MARLSQTNPELYENKTLGGACTSPFLDQVEKQNKEDFNARQEGREPRTVVALNRHPQFMGAETVPSDTKPELAYADEIEDGSLEKEFPKQENLPEETDNGLVDLSDLDEDKAVKKNATKR